MRQRWAVVVAVGALTPSSSGIMLASCTPSDGRDEQTIAATNYCEALAGYVARCGAPSRSACTLASYRDCRRVVQPVRAEILRAVGDCFLHSGCVTDDSGSAASSPLLQCYFGAVSAVPPSAAEARLSQDYCAACASLLDSGVPACASSFYGSDGGVSPGVALFNFGDEVIDQVDRACASSLSSMPDGGCDPSAFSRCAQGFISDASPSPPECLAP